MGHRLHVAKKYEIHNLLTALDISYNGESWDDDVEVYREDFRLGLEKLKNYDKLDEEKRTKIDEALSEFDEPIEEIEERIYVIIIFLKLWIRKDMNLNKVVNTKRL